MSKLFNGSDNKSSITKIIITSVIAIVSICAVIGTICMIVKKHRSYFSCCCSKKEDGGTENTCEAETESSGDTCADAEDKSDTDKPSCENESADCEQN